MAAEPHRRGVARIPVPARLLDGRAGDGSLRPRRRARRRAKHRHDVGGGFVSDTPGRAWHDVPSATADHAFGHRAVLVEIAGEPYAFPHNRIDRLLPPAAERTAVARASAVHRSRRPARRPRSGTADARPRRRRPVRDELFIVLFSNQTQQYGLVVDGFRGEQDLVVAPARSAPGQSTQHHAAAILEDGSPVLIVDVEDLRRSIEKLLHGRPAARADSPRTSKATAQARAGGG